MSTIRIRAMLYGNPLIFETSVKFPEFKYGCHARTDVIQEELSKEENAIHRPHHDPECFIVENIVQRDNKGLFASGDKVAREDWYLGT